MNTIDIKLHFTSKKQAPFNKLIALLEQSRDRTTEEEDKLITAKASALAYSFTLSEHTTNLFFENVPPQYLDLNVDVIHPRKLPFESGDYMSLSNPDYCSTEDNLAIISHIETGANPEFSALLVWMNKHNQEGWLVVGLHSMKWAGADIERGNLTLCCSDYITPTHPVNSKEAAHCLL